MHVSPDVRARKGLPLCSLGLRRQLLPVLCSLSALWPAALRADAIPAPNAIRESATAQKADGQLRSPSTLTGQQNTTLRLYYSNATSCDSAMLVFQLPDLQGKPIDSASLTVTAYKSNANNTYTQAVDLYAVRRVANTVATSDTELSTGDFPVQPAFAASNNGVGIMDDFIPKNTTTAPDGPYSTSPAAGEALGAWLQAQYDAGALPGDYVFLRLNVDTNPNGFSGYYYRGWLIYTGDSASNQPVLTINTVAAIEVKGHTITAGDVWSNGTVRTAGVNVLVGRGTSVLSAGVFCFDMPDLNGAAISSAKLKFRVNSMANQTSGHYTNMNVEAIRSGPVRATRLGTDYQGLGLRPGEVLIQSEIARWDDGGLPRNYETSAVAGETLAAWLTSQYATTGTGGVAYLRLAPSRDPGFNTTNFQVPVDSVELIITTDGAVTPLRGYGNTVTAKVGSAQFSWTFDRAVEWGHFVDGQPWVVMPPSGILSLTAASPARLNNQAVYVRPQSAEGTVPFTADINITVKNPPFDHTFNGNTWVDDPNGVFGWDSRGGHMSPTASPKYNASLGWDGITPLSLAVGDSITTPKAITSSDMPSRATMLDALGVLTVLGSVPPDDAFRPSVIRAGADRTNPEILRYSNLINLDPYLIPSPVGVTTDLSGLMILGVPSQYRFYELKACVNGPWFMNTGMSVCEGVNAIQNQYSLPGTNVYGGHSGLYVGYAAIGSMASWLTPEERKSCRIRYIQRAIDVYGAVKSGLCLEEGAGIVPGYSTLLTTAGVMLNHAGMKSVNSGVNGIAPHWVFGDYATMWHTDGVPSSDLSSAETASDRLIPLYSSGTTNYPDLNEAGQMPIAASSADTMTIRTDYQWAKTGRVIWGVVNLKVKITGGAGAGSTIYTITEAITEGVTDDEKFRDTKNRLYPGTGNVVGYVKGGKVRVKPAWTNGLPDATSVVTFSLFARDSDNPTAENARWFYSAAGRKMPSATPVLEKVDAISVSPIAEYASVHTGATIDNLIVLYSLGQQSLYKGGVDKYLIQAGLIPGYGEELFKGEYLTAVGWNGATYNIRGALWKQQVLNPQGLSFQFTGSGAAALPVPHTHAKLWNEP